MGCWRGMPGRRARRYGGICMAVQGCSRRGGGFTAQLLQPMQALRAVRAVVGIKTERVKTFPAVGSPHSCCPNPTRRPSGMGQPTGAGIVPWKPLDPKALHSTGTCAKVSVSRYHHACQGADQCTARVMIIIAMHRQGKPAHAYSRVTRPSVHSTRSQPLHGSVPGCQLGSVSAPLVTLPLNHSSSCVSVGCALRAWGTTATRSRSRSSSPGATEEVGAAISTRHSGSAGWVRCSHRLRQRKVRRLKPLSTNWPAEQCLASLAKDGALQLPSKREPCPQVTPLRRRRQLVLALRARASSQRRSAGCLRALRWVYL